jgi:apoptosis-inducing factor 2
MLETEVGFKEYSAEKFGFVLGTATALDTTARTVIVQKADGSTETITYYALLIATGAASATPLFGHPGPHTIAVTAIEAFRAKLPEAKSIVIAGGGPAAVETAGEIGHYLNGRAGLFSARPKTIKTKITVVTNANKLLPVLRPALGKKAEKLLGKVGVDVVYEDAVTETEPPTAGKLDADGSLGSLLAPAKVTLSSGKVLEADLYIPAYGLSPNGSWLPAELRDEGGYVAVNKETLRVDAAGSRVYAVGEIGKYGSGGLMELQFAAFPTVMVNMKRDLVHDAKVEASGDEKLVKAGKDMVFKDTVGESQIVPVGRRSGVGAFSGWRFPSFTVWLIKGRQYLTEINNMNLRGAMLKEAKWKEL